MINYMVISMKSYIYILELDNNKYYIGTSTDPQKHIDAHFNSQGPAWTIMNKPIKVLAIIPDCSDVYKYTKIYMKKYGIENVRGGTFSSIVLDEQAMKTLEKLKKNSRSIYKRFFCFCMKQCC